MGTCFGMCLLRPRLDDCAELDIVVDDFDFDVDVDVDGRCFDVVNCLSKDELRFRVDDDK